VQFSIAQMEFQNVFLGGQASWLASDIDSINTAITLAMQDRKLNNVVKQYFDSGVNLTCDARPLLVLDEAKPVQLDEPDVQQLVARLLQQGKVSDSDLGEVPAEALWRDVIMSGRDVAIERVAVLDSPDIAAVHVDPSEVEAPVGFQRTVEPYPGLARRGRNLRSRD
jgi:hypothetical protein